MRYFTQRLRNRLAAFTLLPGLLAVAACNPTAASKNEAPAEPPDIPHNAQSLVVGMGCFWGAEKRMSALPGVLDAEVGYAGGDYQDPSYRDVLHKEYLPGVRNHAEVVKVVFDPARTSAEQVLIGFWQNHDPTQGDRQGNDRGSNYRSAVYFTDEAQHQAALRTRDVYQQALTAAGYGPITTEIAPLKVFYTAEEYHQDYLVKNPNGYCGLGGTGVKYPK
jgi:peptide methionine sulfoxide reductase msrA/msrB